MKLYDLTEAARELNISPATLRNWIKNGRLVPTSSYGGKVFFSVKEINCCKEEIHNKNLLSSRRNKSAAKGNRIYEGYLSMPFISRDTLGCISRILSALPGEGLRLILAEYAIRFFRQKNWKEPAYRRLVKELRGNMDLSKNSYQKTLARLPEIAFVPGEDLLGFLYISLSGMGKRKQNGIYYTPARVADNLLSGLFSKKRPADTSFVDPACGTGNFFLRMLPYPVNPQFFSGRDADALALSICRINIALNFPLPDTKILWENFKTADSLSAFPAVESPAVYLGNPPWGSRFKTTEESFPKFLSGKDSAALFLWKTMEEAKENDEISYLLPASLLSVHSYGALRTYLYDNGRFENITFLGNIFSGVDCPAVILSLKKTASDNGIQKCPVTLQNKSPRETFTITRRPPIDPDLFMLHADDTAYKRIRALLELQGCVTLKGQADFALGIVTGDNKKHLLTKDSPAVSDGSAEIVIRGDNLIPYGFTGEFSYLVFSPEAFQQCAPEKLYRAKGKILYRFIGNTPVFSYDEEGRLSLNSCNIILPNLPDCSAKYVLAFLNSSVARFYFTTAFDSVKLLRRHIESFPIPVVDKARQREIENRVNKLLTLQKNRGIMGDNPENEFEKCYSDLDLLIQKIYREKFGE